MDALEKTLRANAEQFGQGHIFQYWDQLDSEERQALLKQMQEIDFARMDRLIKTWIQQSPEAEHFNTIEPVPVIPRAGQGGEAERLAYEAGEAALRAGRVGLFVVAGGQGTRLGFPGPKGSYPIGPLTQKSLFQYHAEKLRNVEQRYGCKIPWYIMVSHTNGPATEAFFKDNDFFGLEARQVKFFTQRMVPCVDDAGKYMLAEPAKLAMNPNGHGGSIPALVENGILDDARGRGVDCLSYFQVDNWAIKLIDPLFIGNHVLRSAEMSSKNHRKNAPREAVGVHCICDGQYRVIEYSELDIYPQLLETDENGQVVYYAGNPAIHILAVDFVQRIYDHFDQFPWHLAHKKIACLDPEGKPVTPDTHNGYKFETFIFDALRFINHDPIALEIGRPGEYTPIKQYEGDNSVRAAIAAQSAWWAQWLDAAGAPVPRDEHGAPTITIEISPLFAFTQEEFVEKSQGIAWPVDADLVIGPNGEVETIQQ